MEIQKIGVTVRYSREVPSANGKSSWKSVELEADASLSPEEALHWQDKVTELYDELGRQVRVLFARNSGDREDRAGRAATRKPGAAATAVERDPSGEAEVKEA